MIETIGWIGATMLMLCGLPQLIKSIQTKSAGDLSLSFLVTWFLGEVFMVIHLLMKNTWTWPLMINYFVSMIIVIGLGVVWYRYKD